jgi:hypothetical protein
MGSKNSKANRNKTTFRPTSQNPAISNNDNNKVINVYLQKSQPELSQHNSAGIEKIKTFPNK